MVRVLYSFVVFNLTLDHREGGQIEIRTAFLMLPHSIPPSIHTHSHSRNQNHNRLFLSFRSMIRNRVKVKQKSKKWTILSQALIKKRIEMVDLFLFFSSNCYSYYTYQTDIDLLLKTDQNLFQFFLNTKTKDAF